MTTPILYFRILALDSFNEKSKMKLLNFKIMKKLSKLKLSHFYEMKDSEMKTIQGGASNTCYTMCMPGGCGKTMDCLQEHTGSTTTVKCYCNARVTNN